MGCFQPSSAESKIDTAARLEGKRLFKFDIPLLGLANGIRQPRLGHRAWVRAWIATSVTRTVATTD
jgi:hypothetical protein